MIQHPKALVRDELQKAGISSAELHALTDRIAAAYDEANPARPPVPEQRPRFEIVEPGEQEGGR